MNLLTPKNHVVAQIDGKYFIVDTGSPVSFNYCSLNTIELDNGSYQINSSQLAPKRMADSLTGMDISGLIGTDILFKTGLTLDFDNKEIAFSVPQNIEEGPRFYFMPIELYMGQFIITDNILLEGQHLQRSVIDTGAWCSYVSNRYLEKLQKTEEQYEDDSPLYGKIFGNYYSGTISFNSMAALLFNHNVKVGKLPAQVEASGLFDAIIGPDLLSKKLLVFDFRNQRIGISCDDAAVSS